MGCDTGSDPRVQTLTESSPDLPENMRVIGIEEGEDAKAYSVGRLSMHEISNSTLGEQPVAVGY